MNGNTPKFGGIEVGVALLSRKYVISRCSEQKTAISLKGGKIGPKFLVMTNALEIGTEINDLG